MAIDRFYVIRIRFLKDGSIKKSEVMDYDTFRQAETKFHNNLATDMADDTLQGSTCMVINAYGGTMKVENWFDENAPEPESNE